MAGNRRAYDVAMKRAANLAWETKWPRAIEEYEKALAEFPQDVAGLTGLGLAYVETRQLAKALDVYKKAANLAQENPEVIQRVGYVYERLAQLSAAARAYVLAGEAAVRVRDMTQAIDLWHKAAVLAPENLDAHRNLIRAYQDQGEKRKAAWHYLIMARVLARQNQFDEATDCAQEATRLDPRNVEADEMFEALKRGLPLPDGPTARLQPDAEGKRSLDSFVVFEDIEIKDATLLDQDERVSPADLVLRRSLAQLAEALFADDLDPGQMQTYMLLAQAADLQTRGLVEQALNAYMRALDMGADTPAIHFNMGLLFREQQNFEQAIELLSKVISEPDLVLGANFAVGECYYSWGKASKALPYLLETLRLVDSQTVPSSQTSELNAAYRQLRQEHASRNGSPATQLFARSIVEFLSAKGWRERIVRAREQLDSLSQEGVVVALGEMLTEPEAQPAMEAMVRIQAYATHNLLFSALEECLGAIRQAPYYLPLHICMADLLVKEDRPKEAAQKYAVIAQTYQVRNDLHRAINVYRKALNIAPMDIEMREKLIGILKSARQYDQLIEQYIVMADAYYQLAQADRAIEQYNQALKYASHGDPARHWNVNILHRIGDIYAQRVDWRQALRIYQRIKQVEPGDEKARTLLADLYFKLGQNTQALREVDELVEFYKAKHAPDKLVAAMKDLVAVHPQNIPLRMRFAKVYLDMRNNHGAIAELDAIAQHQVDAGKAADAVRTVQAIIRLGPDDVNQYKRLLAQIKNK